QIPALALTALGTTFVLVSGSIDLSVGSIAALAGTVFGWSVADRVLPVPVGVVFALAAGLMVGGVNGMLVNALRVPSFIVTLGMLEAVRGLAYLITNSQTRYLGDVLGW